MSVCVADLISDRRHVVHDGLAVTQDGLEDALLMLAGCEVHQFRAFMPELREVIVTIFDPSIVEDVLAHAFEKRPRGCYRALGIIGSTIERLLPNAMDVRGVEPFEQFAYGGDARRALVSL